MAEILAFLGGLLLAVQVAKWFSALALVIITPFLAISKLIAGEIVPVNSRASWLQRSKRRSRWTCSIPFPLVPFFSVLVLLALGFVAWLISMLDRRLDTMLVNHSREHKEMMKKELNLGLGFSERIGIPISAKLRREKRLQWRGRMLDDALKANRVPFSGMVGLLLVIVAFALKY